MEFSKVLVVDSNRDFLEIASTKLSLRGFHVTTAKTQEEAIGVLKNKTFDALFLNISDDFQKNNILNFVKGLHPLPKILTPDFRDSSAYSEESAHASL